MSQEKERLLARKEKIERRLSDLDKAEAQRRERDEKRKAELAGRAVLARARKDQDFAGRLRAVLDAEITAVRARALFDLPSGRTSAAAESPKPGVASPQQAATPGGPEAAPARRSA